MAISKKFINNSDNIKKVLQMYRSRELLTMKQIAKELQVGYGSVHYIIQTQMSNKERQSLSMLRYSARKIGDKNPMFGKTAEKHHNWKGPCSDQKGYLTIKPNGKRVFQHREIMAKALGLKTLPKKFQVHHLDGNGENNDLNNLALVTNKGHNTIHALQRQEGKQYRLRRLKLAEAMKYLI